MTIGCETQSKANIAFDLSRFDDSLQQRIHALIAESPYTKPVFAAHMTPNLAPYSVLGAQLAAMHHGNLLSAELYPQLQQAETDTLNWFGRIFGFPYPQFTHGGSYSNHEALWQAKQAKSDRQHVYASTAAHYSIHKACQMLNLTLVEIVTDEMDRINLDALTSACCSHLPLAIIGNVGTTVSGAIDPIVPLAALATDYQCWLHLDACWGGARFILPEYQQQLAVAHSVSFDPHKTLFVPKPCSVLLSRHSSVTQPVDYLKQPPALHLQGSYGGELFLPLWLNLIELGEDWFIDKTRNRLQQADQFAQQVQPYINDVVINAGTGVVLFPSQSDLTKLVNQGIVSEVRFKQQRYYRVVFASYETQAEDVMALIRPYL